MGVTATDGGAASLMDVVIYQRDARDRAMDVALSEAIDGTGGPIIGRANEYVGAARLLFERDPVNYAARDYGSKICDLIRLHAPDGTRGTLSAVVEAVAGDDERQAELEGI